MAVKPGRLFLYAFLFGLSADICAWFLYHQVQPGLTHPLYVPHGVMLCWIPLIFRYVTRDVYEPDKSYAVDPRMSQFADSMANHFGIEGGVDVFETYSNFYFRLFPNTRHLVISKKLVELLSTASLQFMIAREIARMKRTKEVWSAHELKALLSFSLLMLWTNLALADVGLSALTGWAIGTGLAACTSVILTTLYMIKGPIGSLEFWCDEQALKATGDKNAALNAIDTLYNPKSPWQIRISGRPNFTARMATLQSVDLAEALA